MVTQVNKFYVCDTLDELVQVNKAQGATCLVKSSPSTWYIFNGGEWEIVGGQSLVQEVETVSIDKQDVLVSGTNIKTINSNSLLGSGNLVLSGTGDLLSTNNLSDLSSISTARTNLGLGTLATQSGTFSGTSSGTNTGDQDLSGKQEVLISGTNIKTVNGSSVLGAGDLVVSGSTAWGGITGTLASQTDLATRLDEMVTEASTKGGAATVNDRLNTISNFASPNAGGVVTGQYYDNSFQGTASSTLIGAANRIELAPYYTSVPLSINQIGVAVSTAVASSTVKIVIYSSDSNGWPNTLLYETAALSTAATGYVFESLTFSFSSGVQYWVGVRHSSTATLRTINVSSAVNLGLTSSTAANYATVLRRTLTYATAATSPWNFVNSDRVANITPPSIRFRAA